MNYMKTNKLNLIRVSFAAVVACLSLAGLASFGAESQGNRGQFSAHDYRFVTDAATGCMEEVDLGRLATQKAENPQVKQFGQLMVTDHQKANDELKQLVTQKGATLPTTPTRTEER